MIKGNPRIEARLRYELLIVYSDLHGEELKQAKDYYQRLHISPTEEDMQEIREWIDRKRQPKGL